MGRLNTVQDAAGQTIMTQIKYYLQIRIYMYFSTTNTILKWNKTI